MPTMLGRWNFDKDTWENPTNVNDTMFGDVSSTAPDYSPDTTRQTKLQNQAKFTSKMGLLTASFGAITSAIGGFYAAKSAQYEAKSAASNYQFQSDMDALNARSSEADAQSILEAGKSDIMRYTLNAGQDKAAVTAHTAASGVVLGVGSARDVAASQDVVKDIDVMTINSNATRAAWAKRVQATNYKNRSMLENVSSQNSLRTARSISPWMSATGSLLGSASRIGTQWLAGQDER